MTEPKTTGEAIQIIRRVLYDLARQPGWNGHATEPEILNYCIAHKLPVPVTLFEKAKSRLLDSGEMAMRAGNSVADHQYWLTGTGDLAEELKRRSWLEQVAAELREPRTFVQLLFAVLGFAFGLVSGLFLGSASK